MGINITTIRQQVDKALSEYGTEFTVYRDIYEVDELGCREIKQRMSRRTTIRGLLDTSAASAPYAQSTENKGVLKSNEAYSLYVVYDEDLPVKLEDYVMIGEDYYLVKSFTNVMYYNILLKLSVEKVRLNE